VFHRLEELQVQIVEDRIGALVANPDYIPTFVSTVAFWSLL
jgi:hypothetical protein